MRRFIYSFPILCMLFLVRANGLWAADFTEVEKILGTSAKMQEGAVVFPFPRSDIKVKIDGEPVPTPSSKELGLVDPSGFFSL